MISANTKKGFNNNNNQHLFKIKASQMLGIEGSTKEPTLSRTPFAESTTDLKLYYQAIETKIV